MTGGGDYCGANGFFQPPGCRALGEGALQVVEHLLAIVALHVGHVVARHHEVEVSFQRARDMPCAATSLKPWQAVQK